MFNKMMVQKALICSMIADPNSELQPNYQTYMSSSVISLMIYNIFGGRILKTHQKKGWHFYNLIDNERFDFAVSEISKSSGEVNFEDLPSTPDETTNYFEQEEYSNFFIRFIWAFEEAVGLDKFRQEITT